MAYHLGSGIWNSVFAVPNDVTDTHLKLASGLSVKVLLLLLRHDGALEPADMARMLGQAVADIQDAVNYWVAAGVVGTAAPVSGQTSEQAEPEQKELTPTVRYETLPEPEPAEPVSAPPTQTEAPRRVATLSGGRRRFATHEINEMAREDENIAYLLQETQSVLGKPLTPVSTDTVVALYSYYGMQPDLILMLIHYCVSINKSSMRYIEKVAANWLDKGIDTHEKAEAEILQLTQKNTVEGKIKSAFGIYDRTLVTSERNYIQTWTEEYQQDLALITLAYERSVEIKGKLSFAYINGILTNWHKQGVRTTARAMQEIREKRPNAQKKGAGGEKASSYDIGELEEMISQGNLV